MKPKRNALLALALAGLLGVAPAQGIPAQRVPAGGATADPARIERLLVAMGTTLHIEVAAADRAAALAASEAAARAVQAAEERLSTWRADSELSRWLAAPVGRPFRPSPSMGRELTRVWQWAEATAGAFDPCVGALVAAYDLRGRGRWPSSAELAAIRRLGSYRDVLVGDVLLRRRALRVEEGAFAKGAALDAAVVAARAAGAHAGRFDFGGQVAWLGGARRAVELADPRARNRPVLRLVVDGGSVATTGNGERRRSVDGRDLGHVLDPRTGRPAADFGSLTVWCQSALDADCLSTACFVLGPDEALAFAERTAGVEVVALVVDGETATLSARVSSGLRALCSSLAPELDIQTRQP